MKKTLFFLLLLFATPAFAQPIPQSRAEMQMSLSPLVKKTAPAVVNIFTRRVVQERLRVISPFFNDPFFSQFFGGSFAGPVQERIQNSLGSGVILDDGGIIATNHHVIKDADHITVVLNDGREFEAQKILDDDKIDLAVLKIDAKGEKLPFLDLADSDSAEVGDLVLAIGNPFGVGQTVTSGIISGLARADVGISDYGFFIQTDAAINPGNSGGALVDINGRLVGVNTAIYSRDGGSLGIGFAIPSSMVRNVLQAAKSGGKLVHPWSGVTGQTVTADMVEGLGLKRATGALIAKVVPGSPADKAGIKPGDVVLAVGGHELQGPQAMKFRLATVPLGSVVKVAVWRGGKQVDLEMTTAAPPEIPPRDETKIDGANPLSGVVVVNISPAVIEEIGPLGQDAGVVVYRVEGGNAARIGLKPGDIISAVNGEKVETSGGLARLLKKKSRGWRLDLSRDGQAMSLMISG